MKTFVRKRKSSQSEDLTNGPPQKSLGAPPGPAEDDPYELNDYDDQEYLGVAVARAPRVGSPGTTKASPSNQAAGKRKVSRDSMYLQRKEARVEAPCDSNDLERQTTPVQKLESPPDGLPAAKLRRTDRKEERPSLHQRQHQGTSPPRQDDQDETAPSARNEQSEGDSLARPLRPLSDSGPHASAAPAARAAAATNTATDVHGGLDRQGIRGGRAADTEAWCEAALAPGVPRERLTAQVGTKGLRSPATAVEGEPNAAEAGGNREGQDVERVGIRMTVGIGLGRGDMQARERQQQQLRLRPPKASMEVMEPHEQQQHRRDQELQPSGQGLSGPLLPQPLWPRRSDLKNHLGQQGEALNEPHRQTQVQEEAVEEQGVEGICAPQQAVSQRQGQQQSHEQQERVPQKRMQPPSSSPAPPPQQQQQQQEQQHREVRPQHGHALQQEQHLQQSRRPERNASEPVMSQPAAGCAVPPRPSSEPVPACDPPGATATVRLPATKAGAAATASATAAAFVVAAAAAGGSSGGPPAVPTQVAAVAAKVAGGGSGRVARPIGRGRLPGLPPLPQQTPPVAGGSSRMGSTAAAAAAAVTLTPPKSTPCPAARPTRARSADVRAAAAAACVSTASPNAPNDAIAARAAGTAVRQDTPSPGEELGKADWGGPSRATTQGFHGRIGSQGSLVTAATAGEAGPAAVAAAAAAAAAAAHSIVEAQECGELLQLQDDAQYALDGLASVDKALAAASGAVAAGPGPGPGVGAVRESAAALATILATRRGRAALSQPGNLAMKALTSLARVAVVPRDPVAALAAAVILLSLVQDDALPAYSASYAAAVLLRHVLLQSEVDAPPLLHHRAHDAPAAAAAGAHDNVCGNSSRDGEGANDASASAWVLFQEARSAAAGLGAGTGVIGGSSSCDGTVLKLLRLVQEGPLARQIGRTDLVMGPLPLVLLAMVVASEASSARIKYAERFKDNLLKVGTLALLGRLVAVRRDAVVRHVYGRRAAAAQAGSGAEVPSVAAVKPSQGAVAECGEGGPRVGCAAPPEFAGALQTDTAGGCTAGLRTASPRRHVQGSCDVVSGDPDESNRSANDTGGGGGGAKGGVPKPFDPYMFEGSEPRNGSQSQPSLVPPSGGTPPLHAAGPPPPAAPAGPPAPPPPLPLWCLWELQLLLRVLENATFTHKRNEKELLALRVSTAMPLEQAAEAAAAAAVAATAATMTTATPPMATSQPAGDTQLVGSQPTRTQVVGSQMSQQGLELLEAPKQPEGCATEEAPFVAILVDVVRQLSQLMDGDEGGDRSGGGAGGSGGGAGRAAGGAPPAVPVPPSAAAVCHVGAAVLMNLTHEHPDGVAVVAAAGGLQAVGGLVWRCCRPQLIPAALTPSQQEQHQQRPLMAPPQRPRARLQVCRDTILASMEVLSVGLGLLINMTSHSAENQRALRSAVLMAAAPLGKSQPPVMPQQPTPMPNWSQGIPESLAASPMPSPLPSQQPNPAGVGRVGHLGLERRGEDANAEGADGVDAPRMVPLLCAVLNTMSLPPEPADAAAAGLAGHSEAARGRAPHGQPPCRGSTDGSDEDNGDGNRGAGGSGGLGGGGTTAGARASAWGVDLEDASAGRGREVAENEVTEDVIQEGLQGGQASIAQVYSAILLGYLVAGSDAEAETATGGGGAGMSIGSGDLGGDTVAAAAKAYPAAAARAEARSLLIGGSLHPVAQGISRCLAFYCQAGAITDSSRDALVTLLQRLVRLEELENPTEAVGRRTDAESDEPGLLASMSE